MSRKSKLAAVPTLDFGPSAPAGVQLSNEVRAELIRLTGQDITPDDPIMVAAYLNQFLFKDIVDQFVAKLTEANLGVAEALKEMRQEVLNSVARELGGIDFTQAEARAVQRIDAHVRMSKGFWFTMGVVAAAVFALGILLGRMI